MQKRRGTKMERTLESLFLLLSAFILMEREKREDSKQAL